MKKLEEKAERDQLLLLAESQTVRKLVTSGSSRVSPVRLALEWLGFTAPQNSETDSSTIEIKKGETAKAA